MRDLANGKPAITAINNVIEKWLLANFSCWAAIDHALHESEAGSDDNAAEQCTVIAQVQNMHPCLNKPQACAGNGDNKKKRFTRHHRHHRRQGENTCRTTSAAGLSWSHLC